MLVKDRIGYMDSKNWSDIRRDWALMDLQILYLQSEQRKRREELDALERDIAKMIAHLDTITSREYINRIENPAFRKKMREIARVWKRAKKS